MFSNDLQREYFNKVVCSRNGNYYIFMNFFHVGIVLIAVLYPFLTNTNMYDPIYLVLLYFIIVQWMFLKSECLISYLEKCKIDPNYRMGSNKLSPGLNYIFTNFNINVYNKTESESNNDANLDAKLLSLLLIVLFSYITIRYFKSNKTRFIHIFIYCILIYIYLFKVNQ